MSEVIQREKSASNSIAQAAGRDIVMGGIMVAAIVLFAGTGSSAMISAVQRLLGHHGHEGVEDAVVVGAAVNEDVGDDAEVFVGDDLEEEEDLY